MDISVSDAANPPAATLYRRFIVILAQGVLVAGGVVVNTIFTRMLHDSLPSEVRAGAASAVSAFSSLAFVFFALLFGVVSQHAGIFHAGWMVVGVTLLVTR